MHFDEAPWSRRGFQRTVWLTSALARLGERGIPADAVIRTYFGSRIRRHMVLEVVNARMALSEAKIEFERLPPQLREWLPLVPEHRMFDELVVESLTGQVADAIEDWVQHGAMAHLLSWRRVADRVDIAPEDRVLPAGLDATRWIVDRFTRTALDDWLRPSLDWELAYLSDPVATSRDVGIPATVIAERPISEAMVIRAITRRTREPARNDEVFAGMTRVEVMDNVIALSLRGERANALTLVRKAVEVQPREIEFEQALAFLQIPDSTPDAQRRLRAIRARRDASQPLVTACLAICALREGQGADAVSDLRSLSTMDHSPSYWLWTPATVSAPEPELGEFSLSDWASQMLAAIS